MRDQRTPARLPLRETITLADLAPTLGLDLEGTYALLQTHGIRAAARPITRISRADAQRLRQARADDVKRELRAAGIGAPREDPEVRRARAALGDTSPGVPEHDAEVAALARYFNVAPITEPSERRPPRPRGPRRRPTFR